MLKVGVSELQANLSNFLQKVKEGDVVVIIVHGSEVARLVPPNYAASAARTKLKQLGQTAVIGDVVSPVSEIWQAEG